MKNIKKRKYISGLLTRIFITIIFILFILIINKFNKNLSIEFKNNLFNKSFNFIKVNKLSKKILGKEVFYYQGNKDSIEVLSNNINLDKAEEYLDGEKLKVTSNLPIGSLKSGVVIYIGNKDKYNNTVIIQGVDGYNIWYGNIKDVNVSLYDYIDEHSLIGAADGEYIYLVIEKDNKFFSYDEYNKV